MHFRARRLPLAASLALLLLAAVPARAEWPHDYRLSVVVAPSGTTGNQIADAALPDGSGGAFVLFEDDRSGNKDVYAQHLRNDGTRDPAWPAGGLALCTAAGAQTAIRAVPDASGGFYACWLDARGAVPKNYATRVLATGAIAPGFVANGVLLDAARPNIQHAPDIASDGVGGMVEVCEYDLTPTNHDIIGARLAPTGTVSWSVALYSGATLDQRPSVVLESAVCAMAWGEGTSNISMARFDPLSGALAGGVVTATTTTDPSIGPRIMQDGWNGAFVVYSQKVAAQWTLAATRYFGGAPFTSYGNISQSFGSAIVIGDVKFTGAFRGWIAWGVPAENRAFIQYITREVAGPTLPTAVFLAGAHPLILASDGAGGALEAYGSIVPPGEEFLSARRYTGALISPALWESQATGEGVPAMQLIRAAIPGAMCSDGDGGMILFGQDGSITPSVIHAMRLDRWGAYVGAPKITSVKDVVNDQGGQSRVAWNASYLDRADSPIVDSYRLWRQVPTASAQALLRRGTQAYSAESAAPLEPGAIRLEESATAAFAWELVTTQPAAAFPAYSLTVPTVADSGSGGPANTVYMVESRWTSSNIGWSSPPDSGHSVDNLPPATPAPFTAALVGGTSTQLTWGANSEPDLAGYLLYRGTSAAFVPGPGNLIASPTGTSLLDLNVGFFYKLAAVDSHGNRSGFALVTPSGTLDVPGAGVPGELSLALGGANPSSDGATLRYALPAAGRVRLELYDVHGGLVRELFAGTREAGSYTAAWDGRDAAGAAASSGMYFARLEASGRRLVRRIVLSH